MTSSSDNILLKEKEGFSPQTLEKLSAVAKNSYGLKNPPIGNSELYNLNTPFPSTVQILHCDGKFGLVMKFK